jgi:two-component system response regulator AlgR
VNAAPPLRVLLVDDEALARLRLRTLLGDCCAPPAVVVGEAADAQQALTALRHSTFDLLLLDIHMPGMDGVTLARTLRELGSTDPKTQPAVVFVTAHAEHAVQAFDLEATDYLTKPVRLERLQLALAKVQQRHQLLDDARKLLQKQEQKSKSNSGLNPDFVEKFLIIQDRGRTERVPLSDVLYLKAELKYVTVRTARRSYVLDGSLNELEALHADRFMRIHRNALIARRSVRALVRHHDPEEGEGWAVQLNGLDEVLMVSRRQVTSVRDAIAGRIDRPQPSRDEAQ